MPLLVYPTPWRGAGVRGGFFSSRIRTPASLLSRIPSPGWEKRHGVECLHSDCGNPQDELAGVECALPGSMLA
jgi:hypothetical protein